MEYNKYYSIRGKRNQQTMPVELNKNNIIVNSDDKLANVLFQ